MPGGDFENPRGHGVLPEGIFKIPERAMGIWIKSPIKNPNFVHIFFHLYLISKPFWCCCYHIYFVPLKEPTTSTTNRYMLRNSLSYENLDLFVCVPSDFRWKYLQSAIKNILIFLYIYIYIYILHTNPHGYAIGRNTPSGIRNIYRCLNKFSNISFKKSL